MKHLWQQALLWWTRRLSHQIIVPAVLVTLVFLAALGFVAFQLGQRAVVAQVEARNRQLAVQVGHEINTFFQTQLDTLRLLEPRLLDRAEPDNQIQALRDLRIHFPYTYNDLYLIDPKTQQTMVLTGTLSDVLERGVAFEKGWAGFEQSDTMRATLEKRQITISPVSFSPITNAPSVTMTLPLDSCADQADCAVDMVLVAQIDLRSFWTKVDSIAIESGSVSIVDERGVLLAHPNRQRVGQQIDHQHIQKAFEGYGGTAIYNYDGVTYLAAYAPISNLLRWAVLVEQDRDYALKQVWQIGFLTTMVTILSGASLFLLLSSVVEKAIMPVTSLSDTAASIAMSGNLRGELGQNLIPHTSSSNEIGILTDSFNQMIKRLAEAQADLERWNEELEQRVDKRTSQLHTVLEVARISSKSLNEQDVLNTMLLQIDRLVSYDTATIMLLDESGEVLETVAHQGTNKPVTRQVVSIDEFPLNKAVILEAAPQLVSDTSRHPLWRVRPSDQLERGSWIGVPLVVQDQAIGVMGLFKQQVGFYSEEDVTIIAALARQVAVSIAHARLYAASVQRVEQELNVARQIQRHLFPTTPPYITGLQIASFYHPARETTGDFYVFITPAHETQHYVAPFGLLIGDVSGKSLPAALLMAMARSALSMAAHNRPFDPAGVMQTANEVLVGEMPPGSFVASTYMIFDPYTQSCNLVNAAQPSPLLVRKGKVTMLEGIGSHLPLGIIDKPSYSTGGITLEAGDLIICYTDGVIEAFNRAKEIYGFERLEQAASEASLQGLNASQVVEYIVNSVVRWMGDMPQHDDIAIVTICVEEAWTMRVQN
jgi:Serine phosphatase RsbU, regulator of sigma subunit